MENPDGVLENPIRLPKCKHIFGEKCIKKWFQDSDTCPYCRDKLPSEISIRKSAAFEGLRARQERFVAITAQSYRARQHGFPPRYPSSEELAAQERYVSDRELLLGMALGLTCVGIMSFDIPKKNTTIS